MTRATDGRWNEVVLYSLGDNGGGAVGPVAFDSDGNIYAAAMMGGAVLNAFGSVFKLMPRADGSWSETALHQFTYDYKGVDRDGRTPYAGVLVRGGEVFGTTSTGGIYDNGVVFSIKQH